MMQLSSVERGIMAELKTITKRKLKGADLLEWSTSEMTVKRGLRDGEVLVHCPDNGVWCAITAPTKGADHGGK